MKTKEELNALKEEVKTMNKKFHALTDDELTQVSGGKVIENLDGLNDKDVGDQFEYNGVCYHNSCMSARDSKGTLCFIYVAKGGGSMVLIPQETAP